MDSVINRLLVVAPPGDGKTTMLRAIMMAYRIGGRIFDPMREMLDAGDRWDVLRYPWMPDPMEDPDDWDDIDRTLFQEVEPHEAVLIDECGRFMPPGCSPKNPVLRFIDEGRNRGCKLLFCEKKPSRLHALTHDLGRLAFRPWQSASGNGWLKEAGVDLETVPPLPQLGRSLRNPWYILKTGGLVEKVEAGEIVSAFCREGNFKS